MCGMLSPFANALHEQKTHTNSMEIEFNSICQANDATSLGLYVVLVAWQLW